MNRKSIHSKNTASAPLPKYARLNGGSITSTSCISHFAHGRERCRLIIDLWIRRMGDGWSVDWDEFCTYMHGNFCIPSQADRIRNYLDGKHPDYDHPVKCAPLVVQR